MLDNPVVLHYIIGMATVVGLIIAVVWWLLILVSLRREKLMELRTRMGTTETVDMGQGEEI